MAVAFKTETVDIPKGTGSRTIERTVNFGRQVRSAGVALNGFQLNYSDGDHHINEVEADTDVVSVSGTTVKFRVQCRYADKNFDDPYHGYVTALVIADLN